MAIKGENNNKIKQLFTVARLHRQVENCNTETSKCWKCKAI